MRGLFQTVGDQCLPKRLIVLIKTRARSAMPGRFGNDLMLVLGNFYSAANFFRRSVLLDSHQLATGLLPIGIGKIIGLTFVDQRDLARTPLDQLWGGRADAIAVHGNFSEARL